MPAASRTIYFKNNAGCIWEESQGYVRLEYTPGIREEAQFRALLTHARQALHRRGWGKMLINQEQMSGFNPSEESWIVNEWLPLAVKEDGYRYGALIVAHNVFARLATANLVLTSRQLGHVYRNFEHDAEAVAWLLKQ
ncbi:MAG: hypothetical protein EOO56_22535 [Hymenobacter sp.]|nr:MAG: hypothetical protein EOO56_22535 [Hymenobacter sp.]